MGNYNIDLRSNNSTRKINLFEYKSGGLVKSTIVNGGKHEIYKGLIEATRDLLGSKVIDQVKDEMGPPTPEGLSNIESGKDFVEWGQAAIPAGAALYASGASTTVVVFVSVFGALALAGGLGILVLGIAQAVQHLSRSDAIKNNGLKESSEEPNQMLTPSGSLNNANYNASGMNGSYMGGLSQPPQTQTQSNSQTNSNRGQQ